jgi:hypothetical protein
MIVKQTGGFKRRVKKMHSAEKKALDKVVKEIISAPSIGEMKIGDLNGVQVYKYKLNTQQYLLAYQYIDHELLRNYSAAENYRNITLRAVMIFYSPIGSRDSKIS